MRTLTSILAITLCGITFASPAFAEEKFPQVYPKSAFLVRDREKLGGDGLGTVHCEYAFPRDKALKDQAIKEIAWLTLPPGASISLHKHEVNEDAYIVVSGSGVFFDETGKETAVKAGDVTIARKGDSHGMKNTGSIPLIILDVIAQQ